MLGMTWEKPLLEGLSKVISREKRCVTNHLGLPGTASPEGSSGPQEGRGEVARGEGAGLAPGSLLREELC